MPRHSPPLKPQPSTLTSFEEWLAAQGGTRLEAVERAAERLLEQYRIQWPNVIPTELHRLAAGLGAPVSYVKDLEGGARLVPVPGGFRVLVSEALPPARVRAAIAHELAHIVFYDAPENRAATAGQQPAPRRLVAHSADEEHFCFDVARRILAPRWMLEAIGLAQALNAETLFEMLRRKMRLSRPIAAQLALADYRLLRGVAGYWEKDGDTWSLCRSRVYASPALNAAARKVLHGFARRWLESGAQPIARERVSGDTTVFGSEPGTSAFVLVARLPDS